MSAIRLSLLIVLLMDLYFAELCYAEYSQQGSVVSLILTLMFLVVALAATWLLTQD